MRTGINEIVVRGPFSHASHYEVSIDNTKIQDFSGDGIIISTPVGSTAYNYSLGGSLISPELDVLQLTPIAPMSTSAYRCFNSSLILPSRDTIKIVGIGRCEGGTVMVSFDGRTHEFGGVLRIEITRSDKEISLIRMPSYDHWSKLSSKLL
jgi:NAD+ kinase